MPPTVFRRGSGFAGPVVPTELAAAFDGVGYDTAIDAAAAVSVADKRAAIAAEAAAVAAAVSSAEVYAALQRQRRFERELKDLLAYKEQTARNLQAARTRFAAACKAVTE